MRAVRFQPGALDVAPGDRIAWTNYDAVPHTVTAAEASWDSGEVAPGETFTWVVKGTGTIPYVCRYHPTMRGRLTVPNTREPQRRFSFTKFMGGSREIDVGDFADHTRGAR